MHNFTDALAGVNPNFFGMVDSIACSRAQSFAGTWFSTSRQRQTRFTRDLV